METKVKICSFCWLVAAACVQFSLSGRVWEDVESMAQAAGDSNTEALYYIQVGIFMELGMVEPSKLYEAKISATKHGATGFGICWDSVLFCLIQYILTAPVPPCWNRNTYYVPLYVGYNLVYLFSRGITVEGLLWVSVETLVFGLLNNVDWWCLWRLLKLKKMYCFSSRNGHESTENRELNVAIQMKNVPCRLTFLNSWHHLRVKEKTRYSNQRELGNKQA